MDVSVIIPTLNEAATIRQAIHRAWAAGASQVVVVDGRSEDETYALAGQCDCDAICCNRGRGIQLNAGADLARGEVLLFLHADNWLSAGAVDQIRSTMQNPLVQCGAFRQRIESPDFSFRMVEFGNNLRVRFCGVPFGDQGIFVRHQLFRDVGGFPNVEIMEDMLLMKRIRCRTRPILLPGPLHVSPRRWQQNGVLQQTLRNWTLQVALTLGVAPHDLARYYPAPTAKRDR
jgi:rSAM/selenodomain-associated transferase 2